MKKLMNLLVRKDEGTQEYLQGLRAAVAQTTGLRPSDKLYLNSRKNVLRIQ